MSTAPETPAAAGPPAADAHLATPNADGDAKSQDRGRLAVVGVDDGTLEDAMKDAKARYPKTLQKLAE